MSRAAALNSLSRRGIVAALLLICSPAWAAGGEAGWSDKPFADHHIVLQLSDRSMDKRALVLSVASNLLKAYEPDRVDIEVVAFGPGVDLLRAESPDRPMVDSLVAQGVRFDVCMNTIQTIERETGKPVALNPNARKVEAGVAQILMLAEHGFTVVRP